MTGSVLLMSSFQAASSCRIFHIRLVFEISKINKFVNGLLRRHRSAPTLAHRSGEDMEGHSKQPGGGLARRKIRPKSHSKDVLPLYDIGGSHYIGYRTVLAAKLFDRCIQRILSQHGDVTLPQWRALAQLGQLPTGTVRSLAGGAAVDRSEASRALRELELAGLVRRQTNGDDMRSPIFSLTAEGREVYLRLRIPISQFVSNLVEGVDEADLDAANRVLWAVTSGCLEQT
jgi:DNA-binding MarR family transcriptional regulator